MFFLFYECYCLGYFGLVGNVDITLMDALTKYRQRNEVEVAFKLMFQHLLTSTRVHSSAALDGLLMTTFVGLSILTYLRTKMNGTIPNELARSPERTSSINSLWTIQEMLKDLRRIKLAYTKSGKPRLLNVVKRDRDLAEALGFPGLFDSAENVAKLLSGSHLAATLKKYGTGWLYSQPVRDFGLLITAHCGSARWVVWEGLRIKSPHPYPIAGASPAAPASVTQEPSPAPPNRVCEAPPDSAVLTMGSRSVIIIRLIRKAETAPAAPPEGKAQHGTPIPRPPLQLFEREF